MQQDAIEKIVGFQKGGRLSVIKRKLYTRLIIIEEFYIEENEFDIS